MRTLASMNRRARAGRQAITTRRASMKAGKSTRQDPISWSRGVPAAFLVGALLLAVLSVPAVLVPGTLIGATIAAALFAGAFLAKRRGWRSRAAAGALMGVLLALAVSIAAWAVAPGEPEAALWRVITLNVVVNSMITPLDDAMTGWFGGVALLEQQQQVRFAVSNLVFGLLAGLLGGLLASGKPRPAGDAPSPEGEEAAKPATGATEPQPQAEKPGDAAAPTASPADSPSLPAVPVADAEPVAEETSAPGYEPAPIPTESMESPELGDGAQESADGAEGHSTTNEPQEKSE